MAIAIDPASTAGIALTVLGYGMAASFVGLVAPQIILAPYFWYIVGREYGTRGFFFMRWRELSNLREKYPIYRFVWNLSVAMGATFFLSLFGSLLIFTRYSL